MEKLKISWGGCLAILFNIFFILFLFEFGLRLMQPTTTLTAFGHPCQIAEDPQLGYRFFPDSSGRIQLYNEIDNVVVMNSGGFHDIEHDLWAKSNRILVLGDSFTSANQVPIEAGWTQIVEQELEDTSVINLGVDGYGTARQLKLLEQYAPMVNPQIVILAFFENDVTEILAQTKLDCYDDHLLVYQNEDQKQQLMTFLDESKPSELSFLLGRYSVFYRVVATLTSPSGFLLGKNTIIPADIGISLEPLPEEPPDLLPNLFEQFEGLAEQYDFEMVVIPVPSRDNPEKSLALLTERQIDSDTWKRIQVIDLYPEMKAQMDADGLEHKDLYFEFDGHFNKNGYALFGKQVAEYLLNNE